MVRESEHLYFELEPFKDYLRAWLPEHTTSDVSDKLLEWFDEPLRGWCISRDALSPFAAAGAGTPCT